MNKEAPYQCESNVNQSAEESSTRGKKKKANNTKVKRDHIKLSGSHNIYNPGHEPRLVDVHGDDPSMEFP